MGNTAFSQYPAPDGWGVDGLAVLPAGRVYRFRRPVSKIRLINNSDATIYVGLNAAIVGAAGNDPVGQPGADQTAREANERRVVTTLTAAQALERGVPIAPDTSLDLEAPLAGDHAARNRIYSVWFITPAATPSKTVHGGVIGY